MTIRILLLGTLALVVPVIAQTESEAQECLGCHGDRARLVAAQGDATRDLATLFVDATRFHESVHARQDCTECHAGFDEHPHPEDGETVSCGECHEEAAEAFAASVHGAAKEGVERLPVSCGACHGVHDVLPASNRNSRLHPLQVYKVCGQCHFSVDPATATVEQILTEPYTDDTHAHGILRSGLSVSATCVSCHGDHDIRRKGDPESAVDRVRVDQVCGKCHLTVVDDYRQSVHHVRGNGEDHAGATCSDCHPPHAITTADVDFKVRSVATCSRCHEQRAGTFRATYHGKLSSLGFGEKVATCQHCHGSHRIFEQSDPRSKIHPDNLVQTCAECHESSHESFVAYQVHADPDDAEAYPDLHLVKLGMSWLLICVFAAGGLHVVLWLTRSILDGEWAHRVNRARPQRYVRRWRPFYVGLHVTVMSTVLVLALTGIPLHYSEEPWSLALMRFVGGAEIAAFLHRFGAIGLTAGFAVYLLNLLWRLVVRRERGLFTGPNTMMPRWQDLKDFAANVRWFLGRGAKPRFDRWTYWEKFDFWAVFWGMAIIGGSGVMLWLPEGVTRFVSGRVVNAAQVIHGHEALLAVGFLFTIHLFHTHLRPDKFPMDLTFYTGRITEEEFKRERPLEYERALAEGRMESLIAREPRPYRFVAGYVVGGITVAFGLLLLAGMLAALMDSVL